MVIALAQIQSLAGRFKENRDLHLRVIEIAGHNGVDLLLFPELSLTGYEPNLARDLACTFDSPLLDPIQEAAKRHQLLVGTGMPVWVDDGVAIGMVLFTPQGKRSLYTKRHIHPDEEPFFVPSISEPQLPKTYDPVGWAICYELSVTDHADAAYRNGKTIYLASVAKSEKGVQQAHARMSAIAADYGMITGMVNNLGPSDDFVGAGQSAFWNQHGNLLGQISTDYQGILSLDTITKEVKTVSV